RSSVWCAVGMWATVASCAAALWSIPSARESIAAYFNVQIVSALAGRREVSGNSFTIVIELCQGVLLPLAVAMALAAMAGRAWMPPSSRDRRVALVFVLIGLSGTLPMLISPKQTGHYLMPAVPFYAIAAGALTAATLTSLGAGLSSRGVAALRLLAAAVALVGLASIWLPALE